MQSVRQSILNRKPVKDIGRNIGNQVFIILSYLNLSLYSNNHSQKNTMLKLLKCRLKKKN